MSSDGETNEEACVPSEDKPDGETSSGEQTPSHRHQTKSRHRNRVHQRHTGR